MTANRTNNVKISNSKANVHFHLQCFGALGDSNSSESLSAPASSATPATLAATSSAATATSLAASTSGSTALSSVATSPALTSLAPVSSPATTPSPASATAAGASSASCSYSEDEQPAWYDCTEANVVTAASLSTAICLCYGSSFTGNLCGVGNGNKLCGYTTKPTSTILLSEYSGEAGLQAGASTQPGATTAASEPSPASQATSSVAVSSTTTAPPTTTSVAVSSTTPAPTSAATTTPPSAVSPGSEPENPSTTCAAIDPRVSIPAGTGVFYVYHFQNCTGPATTDCNATDPRSFGMVHVSNANCGWFEALWPDGWTIFNDNSTQTGINVYVDNKVPEPDDLMLHNPMRYCKLNNLTFQRQCDG